MVPGNGGVCTIAIRFHADARRRRGRRTAALAFTFTGVLPDQIPIRSTSASPATPCCRLGAVGDQPQRRGRGRLADDDVDTADQPLASLITLSSFVFSGTAANDYSLAAGNTCTRGAGAYAQLQLHARRRFNPPAAGARNATLTISHSAAGSPQTVAFLGTATPALQGRSS